MTMKRQSLKLDDIDWQVLLGIAADCGCEYRGTPSWRRLFDDIASGKLSVVNRPDKRVRDFQAKRRRPMIEQRQKQQAANWTARGERDRLRQEQNGVPLAFRRVALKRRWMKQWVTAMSSAG